MNGAQEKEWAVITGASSGIGEAFASQLAGRGYRVLLVARRREELERVAARITGRGGEAQILAADLGTSEGVKAVARTVDALGPLGVLVNNAGFGGYGEFLAQPLERDQAQVALNIGAVVGLTKLLLPRMLARGRGQIINVASVLSFMPVPYFATYAGTKAFVLQFTEALGEELRGSGVRALAVCPGTVRTEFMGVSGMKEMRRRLPLLDPEDVARVSLDAAAGKRVVRVVGLAWNLLVFLARITPRFLMRRIMGAVLIPAAGRLRSAAAAS